MNQSVPPKTVVENYQELAYTLKYPTKQGNIAVLILNTFTAFSKQNQSLKNNNNNLLVKNNIISDMLASSNWIMQLNADLTSSLKTSMEANSSTVTNPNLTQINDIQLDTITKKVPPPTNKRSSISSDTIPKKAITSNQNSPFSPNYSNRNMKTNSSFNDVYAVNSFFHSREICGFTNIYSPPKEYIGLFYTNNICDFSRKLPFYKSIDLLDFQDLAKHPTFLFNPPPPPEVPRSKVFRNKNGSLKPSTCVVYALLDTQKRKDKLKFVVGYPHLDFKGIRYFNWF